MMVIKYKTPQGWVELAGMKPIDISQSPAGITINGTELQNATSSQDGLMTKEQVKQVDDIGIVASMSGQTLSMEVNGKKANVDIPRSSISWVNIPDDSDITKILSTEMKTYGDKLAGDDIYMKGDLTTHEESTRLYGGFILEYLWENPIRNGFNRLFRIDTAYVGNAGMVGLGPQILILSVDKSRKITRCEYTFYYDDFDGLVKYQQIGDNPHFEHIMGGKKYIQ